MNFDELQKQWDNQSSDEIKELHPYTGFSRLIE